jgi:hypothetical protein
LQVDQSLLHSQLLQLGSIALHSFKTLQKNASVPWLFAFPNTLKAV